MDDRDDASYARAPEPEDLVRICRALNDAGARYVLIGGFAVGARVPVASPSALVRTKDTYRPQDAIDRSFLEQLLERRQRE